MIIALSDDNTKQNNRSCDQTLVTFSKVSRVEWSARSLITMDSTIWWEQKNNIWWGNTNDLFVPTAHKICSLRGDSESQMVLIWVGSSKVGYSEGRLYSPLPIMQNKWPFSRMGNVGHVRLILRDVKSAVKTALGISVLWGAGRRDGSRCNFQRNIHYHCPCKQMVQGAPVRNGRKGNSAGINIHERWVPTGTQFVHLHPCYWIPYTNMPDQRITHQLPKREKQDILVLVYFDSTLLVFIDSLSCTIGINN